MSVITERLLDNIRVNLPGADDQAIRLAVFQVVDDLARNTLQIPPPDASTPDLDAWMGDALWSEHQQLVIDGTLGRMMAEQGKPYFKGDLAQAHLTAWTMALASARAKIAAATATSSFDRIMANVRVMVPGARDGVIQQQMFNVVEELTRDTLQITVPGNGASPSSWLSEAQWSEHQRLVEHGTLARLYLMPGVAWNSTDLGQVNASIHAALLDNVRQHLASPTAGTYYDRIMQNVRVRCTGARDGVISQELFATIDDLTRNYIQTTPPDTTAPPSTWLTDDLWEEHMSLLIDGTCFRLKAQAGKAYADGSGAELYRASYGAAIAVARANRSTGITDTTVARLMENLRVQAPGARDGVIQMELYNAIDELCRDAFYVEPPDDDAPVEEWLTPDTWREYYRLLMAGTLYRLKMHTQVPWADPEGAKTQYALFQSQLLVARSDASDGPNDALWTQLRDSVRLPLTGLKDGTLDLEWFNTCVEFSQESTAYRRTVEIPLTRGVQTYALAVPKASILTVIDASLATKELRYDDVLYDTVAGTIDISPPIVAADEAYPLFVNVCCKPRMSVGLTPAEYLPADIIERWYETLVDGLKSRLFMHPNQKYSNIKLGEYHGRRYRNGLVSARNISDRQSAVRGTWRYPFFA